MGAKIALMASELIFTEADAKFMRRRIVPLERKRRRVVAVVSISTGKLFGSLIYFTHLAKHMAKPFSYGSF
jgi:hypothetical protein